jgi:hypothetical protein
MTIPATDPTTGYAPLPTGQDVADFLGDPEARALADQHVDIVAAMARAYVRGNGFGQSMVARDIAAAIITAAARLVANPEQIESAVGPIATRGGFAGWTLAETFVLNAYRGRAPSGTGHRRPPAVTARP